MTSDSCICNLTPLRNSIQLRKYEIFGSSGFDVSGLEIEIFDLVMMKKVTLGWKVSFQTCKDHLFL